MLHAEVADLHRIRGGWSLRELILLGPGGAEAWLEIRTRLQGARGALPKAETSISTVKQILTACAAVAKIGRAGFRGFVAPYEVVCELVSVVSGREVSKTTLRNGFRLLEVAGIGARDLGDRHGRPGKGRGRGKGRPYLNADRERRYARRNVLMFTLSEWFLGILPARPLAELRRESPDPLWYLSESDATPIGSKESPSAPRNPSQTRGYSGPTGARDARGSTSVSSRAHRDGSKVEPSRRDGESTRPRDGPSRAPPARDSHTALEQRTISDGPCGPEAASRKRPTRRFAHRPRPEDPQTYRNARRALLYDLETVLLRAGEHRIGSILSRAALETAQGNSSGSCWPWAEVIWQWRALPLEERRTILLRGAVPAVRAALRRDWLRGWPEDPSVAPRRVTPRTPGKPEPGIAGRRVEPGPRSRGVEIVDPDPLDLALARVQARPGEFTEAYRRGIAERSLDRLEDAGWIRDAAWLRRLLE